MKREHYERMREELCHTEKTLHADIAREIDVQMEYNSPTRDGNIHQCTHTDDGALEAWTDGSADDTTHTVGYAVYWGRSHPLNYSRRITYETNTNNTAELNAVLHVLSVTPRDTDVKIYTDSQVTIHTLN